MKRRQLLGAAVGPLLGCQPATPLQGGFVGIDFARGHVLRAPATATQPSVVRHTDVVIAGGGVAGLAAARALRLRGIDDFALLELEDSAGGNSRATALNGLPCPMGAHYLPLPGRDAGHVQDLLEEFGLRQRVAGRWQYDERHLCHSPQERLFFQGAWQDGLLPVAGIGAETLAQYQGFARLVDGMRAAAHWPLPMAQRPLAPVQQALMPLSFASYLDQQGFTDPHLRWYLDYCCRDDYGAGLTVVSAWAGIHYFACRHGFHAPGTADTEAGEGLLTWPEGNAWLTRRLAAPLGARLYTGHVVQRIATRRDGVEVDAWDVRAQTLVRWRARHCVVALPVFIAARVVQDLPDFLRQTARSTVYAPWLVANIYIDAPLRDRPGAAPSWDNVLYGTTGLGYVDATHQSLRPVPGATVLTYYRALGCAPAQLAAQRQQLLDTPWQTWCDTILGELAQAHADLPGLARRIDITRYGHAMAIPVPRAAPRQPPLLAAGRLRFAHADWAGYSVFEEAFTLGHAAGSTI